jgi:hypothetical protein
MAAKVYSLPEGLPEPDFDICITQGSDAYFAACEEHEEAVRQWCIANSDSTRLRGNIVGKVISFGVADGRAQYMIYRHSPLSLIHLPYVDAYEAHPLMLKGLTLLECKRMVRADENLAKLFGRRAS